MRRLRLGTRGSRLALVQSALVAKRLRRRGTDVELVRIVTEGDLRPKDSPIRDGVFVKDLESALLGGEIDLAVHSAKDLPLDPDPVLPIAAYPERADALDALVTSKGLRSVQELAPRARVGTDSPRRGAFLRAIRPDLRVIPLMGNVDTRLRRLDGGEAEALVLAVAGLARLGFGHRIGHRFDAWTMPPAPAQGALAIQVRGDDAAVLASVRAIDDHAVHRAVLVERAILKAFGGGCDAALGAVASVTGGRAITLLAGASTANGELNHRVALSFARADDADAVARVAGVVAAELHRYVPVPTRAVLDTRPQADLALATFAGAGWRVLHVPAVAIADTEPGDELRRARGHLHRYQWVVLTSKRGVAALFDGLDAPVPSSVRWAAVGPTTANALRSRGVEVDAQPAVALGDEIPSAMASGGLAAGDRVLLARADAAARSLPELLRARGAQVDDVVAYRTVEGPSGSREPLLAALADRDLEAVVFASGSAVRGLVELAGTEADRARRLKVITIGPSTAAVARDFGFEVTGEARTQDGRGLGKALAAAMHEEVRRWVESQMPAA